MPLKEKASSAKKTVLLITYIKGIDCEQKFLRVILLRNFILVEK